MLIRASEARLVWQTSSIDAYDKSLHSEPQGI